MAIADALSLKHEAYGSRGPLLTSMLSAVLLSDAARQAADPGSCGSTTLPRAGL